MKQQFEIITNKGEKKGHKKFMWFNKLPTIIQISIIMMKVEHNSLNLTSQISNKPFLLIHKYQRKNTQIIRIPQIIRIEPHKCLPEALN